MGLKADRTCLMQSRRLTVFLDGYPSRSYLPAMNFEGHLWRYRQNAFTDDDITGCTGLTVRAWRELIKLRAVHTLAEAHGRGRVRVCDATVLKRAAVIAALNHAGFSLAVSGKIAFCVPFHSVLYEIVDPIQCFVDRPPRQIPKPGLLRQFSSPASVGLIQTSAPRPIPKLTGSSTYMTAVSSASAIRPKVSRRSLVICARSARALLPGFLSIRERSSRAAQLQNWQVSDFLRRADG